MMEEISPDQLLGWLERATGLVREKSPVRRVIVMRRSIFERLQQAGMEVVQGDDEVFRLDGLETKIAETEQEAVMLALKLRQDGADVVLLQDGSENKHNPRR